MYFPNKLPLLSRHKPIFASYLSAFTPNFWMPIIGNKNNSVSRPALSKMSIRIRWHSAFVSYIQLMLGFACKVVSMVARLKVALAVN